MSDAPRRPGHPDLSIVTDEFSAGADPAGRAEVVRHLADCRECRAALARSEPAALFALLATEPVPAAVLEQLERRVGSALAAPRLGRSSRRLVAVSGVAASLLLAAALGALLVSPGPARAPADVAVGRPTVSVPAGSGDGRPVELISSPGSARVLDLTVGEIDLVMIFDEALKL